MPRVTREQDLEVTNRLKETAESVRLESWQMKIFQALRLQGATLSVMSANQTDFRLMITPTTLTPVTLLKLFAQEQITVAAAPYTSKKIEVTYSKLARI